MNLPGFDPGDAGHAIDACPAPAPSDTPDSTEVARALAGVTKVAIVGASPNPSRTSYQVAVWLMENSHYEIYLVNPAADGEDVRGHGFYASLADLPITPDLVCVFRRAEFVPDVAAAALEVGAGGLWLQLGIESPEVIADLRGRGLFAVQNRCLKVEYARHGSEIARMRA